jgi:hypothetical protein
VRVQQLFHILCVGVLVVCGKAYGQLTCSISRVDSRYLRWQVDPELYLFARIDPGLLDSMGTDCRTRLAQLQRRIRANGHVHRLRAEKLRAAHESITTDTSFLPDYANQLRELLGAGGPFDIPTEIRVGRDAIDSLGSSNLGGARLLARKMALLFQSTNRPLLTFEADVPALAAIAVKEELQRHGTPCLIGRELDGDERELGPQYDYAIFDPSTFPLPYRDQAAVSFARAQIGERPLLFRVVHAQFYPELFWLATGAAGLRYEMGDDPCAASDAREFSRRRGLATVLRVGRYRPLTLEATALSPIGPASLAVWNQPVRFALPPLSRLEWSLSLTYDQANIYPFWIDVENDVFVELAPLRNQRGRVDFSSGVPSKDRPYVFGCVYLPSANDRQTTIGPITALDGELESEDVVATSSTALGAPTTSAPR